MKYILPFLASLSQLLAVDIARSVTYDSATKIVAPSGLSTSNQVSSSLSSVEANSLVTREYIDYTGSTNVNNELAMSTWGDSITAGDGASTTTNKYPQALGIYSGFRVSNGGVSGENSTQIRARQTAASNTWYQPTIIWAGQNNFSSTNTVATDIAAMVANLESVGNTNRYLVLSILGQTNYYRGTANYAIVTNLNGMLAATYGQNFVDIRSYLISRYNPTNAQDVIDYANDVVPSSLRADNQHLNDYGYPAVAAYILTNSLPTLRGSWSSVANLARVAAYLHQPGAIGDEVPSTVNATTLKADSFTVTNSPTVGNGTGNPLIYLNGGSGGARGFDIYTAGVSRWRVASNGSETGANAGANLLFQSYSDAGAALGYPFQLNRDGTVLMRAPASSSAATYFPVFITSPLSGNPVQIWSRTPTQVRSDIGAAGTVSPTFTGNTTLGDGTGNPLFFINGATNGVKGWDIYNNSSIRWRFATTGTDSGTYDGNSLLLQGYNNSGGGVTYPVQFFRDGTVATRAPATATPAAYFPVYITTPLGGSPAVVYSRTPAEVRSDIGAISMVRGTATLVAGTVTVSTASVTASSIIMLTGQNSSGTHGELTVSAKSAGVSFTITSNSALDTRLIGYTIVEP